MEVEDDHPGDGDRAEDAAARGQQDQRQGELHRRPQVGGQPAQPRGAHVPRIVAVELLLGRPPAIPGGVADHHRDDEGEVAVELRRRRPPPDAEEDQLGGDDHVAEGEEEDDHQVAVDLGPRGQEGDLVAQAQQDQQRQREADGDRVEPAG